MQLAISLQKLQSLGVPYHFPVLHIQIRAVVDIEDPSSYLVSMIATDECSRTGFLTAATSGVMLKKVASNKPMSSLRKCPPVTFVCTLYLVDS